MAHFNEALFAAVQQLVVCFKDRALYRHAGQRYKARLDAAGGIPALVQLLSCPDASIASAAAEATSQLAAAGQQLDTQLRAAGAIPALVQFMGRQQVGDAALTAAVQALQAIVLCKQGGTRAMLEAAAAPALVRLLEGGSQALQFKALKLLNMLSSGMYCSKENEIAAALEAVWAAGAGPAAVRLLAALSSSTPRLGQLLHDADSGCYLAHPVEQLLAEAVSLIYALSNEVGEARIVPDERRASLVQCGAVSALCSALSGVGTGTWSSDYGDQYSAAYVLGFLKSCPEVEAVFAPLASTVLPALVRGLQQAQPGAAPAQFEGDYKSAAPAAGLALRHLAGLPSLLLQIAEAGAIEAAVAQLKLQRPAAAWEAAGVLCELAASPQLQERAVAAGAVAALVQCLCGGSCRRDSSAKSRARGSSGSKHPGSSTAGDGGTSGASGSSAVATENGSVSEETVFECARALCLLTFGCPAGHAAAHTAGAVPLLQQRLLVHCSKPDISSPAPWLLRAFDAIAVPSDWRRLSLTAFSRLLRQLAAETGCLVRKMMADWALERIEEEEAAAAAAEAALLAEEEEAEAQQRTQQQQQPAQPSSKAAKRQRQRERQRAAAAAAAAAAGGAAEPVQAAAEPAGMQSEAAPAVRKPGSQTVEPMGQGPGAAAAGLVAGRPVRAGEEGGGQQAPSATDAQGGGSGSGAASSSQPAPQSSSRRRKKQGVGRNLAAAGVPLPMPAARPTAAAAAAAAAAGTEAAAVLELGASTEQAAPFSEAAELEVLLQQLGVGDSAAEMGTPAAGGASTAGGSSPPPVMEQPVAVEAGPASPPASASTSTAAARQPSAGLDPALLADLKCPLTLEAMRDPVVAADGCTYERAAIAAWIARQQAGGQVPCSPLTGAPLSHLNLNANRLARSMIASLQAAGLLSP